LHVLTEERLRKYKGVGNDNNWP